MSDYFDRMKIEMHLADLVDRYTDLIVEAWEECHGTVGHAGMYLRWSKDVSLVTEYEESLWRRAFRLRNLIFEREFRVVTEDVEAVAADLRPIVVDLPARMTRLGLTPSHVTHEAGGEG